MFQHYVIKQIFYEKIMDEHEEIELTHLDLVQNHKMMVNFFFFLEVTFLIRITNYQFFKVFGKKLTGTWMCAIGFWFQKYWIKKRNSFNKWKIGFSWNLTESQDSCLIDMILINKLLKYLTLNVNFFIIL